jgi:hypothetical protein
LGNVRKVLQKGLQKKEGHGIRGVSTKITKIRRNGGNAMTQKKCTGRRINLQEIFGVEKDSFKELLREVLQDSL